jgi:hypothetical protein
MPANAQSRPLYVIAGEIIADPASKSQMWKAGPYVQAMAQLDRITESYGYDSADGIVRYALSNLTGWRGETARRVKAELKAML